MNASKSKTHLFFGIPKLPARHASLVMPLLLSIFMTCIVSLISTFKGLGPHPQFLRVWLGAWAVSWVVAFPTLLLVLPVVKKLTAALVQPA